MCWPLAVVLKVGFSLHCGNSCKQMAGMHGMQPLQGSESRCSLALNMRKPGDPFETERCPPSNIASHSIAHDRYIPIALS